MASKLKTKKEFENYGKQYKTLFTEIVDDDKEGPIKQLYGHLNGQQFPVIYKGSFTEAMGAIIDIKYDLLNMVVVTRIELPKGGFHSIAIFKNKTVIKNNHKTISIYLFDPNGDVESSLAGAYYPYYKNPYNRRGLWEETLTQADRNAAVNAAVKTALRGKKYATEAEEADAKAKAKAEVEADMPPCIGFKCLADTIKDMYPGVTINMTYPEYKGVQNLCIDRELGYIDKCGYCMFLNYFLIEHVTENLTDVENEGVVAFVKSRTDIKNNDRKKETKLKEIFGETDDEKEKSIGDKVGEVIKEIFNYTPCRTSGRKRKQTGTGYPTGMCTKCGKQKNPYV